MTPPRSRALPGRQLIADSVYDALLAQLFDNSLQADAALNIDQISREFDVSQTPVREALARLEATGLVIRTALKGYRVAPKLTPQEVDDLMDARSVVETALTERAARRVDPDFLTALSTSIEKLSSAPTGPGFAEYHAYWEADERFHDLIAHQAGNSFLYRAFHALGGQAQRFRLFGNLGVSDAGSAVTEHTVVLDALTRGDVEAAAAAMTAHILGVRTRALADAEQEA